MKIATLNTYTCAALAGYCAIMLTGQSPPQSSREETFEKQPSYSLAVAPLGQSNSSEFSLKKWLSDNGSGGFPENFSDEDRILDEWETIPDTH